MPLRRPPEPSARLLAVLSREREGAAVPFGRAGDGALAATEATAWVPAREEVTCRPSLGGDTDRVSERPRSGSGRHRRPKPPSPALLMVPEGVRGARLSSSSMAVGGVVLVLLVAAVAFLARVAWARSAATPTAVPTRSASALVSGQPSGSRLGGPRGTVTTGPAGTPGGAAAGAAAVAAVRVEVHVVGQVHHPGVVRLQGGSRVTDAVTAAGGALPSADLSAVNLARLVVDGEQIRIPRPGEVTNPPVGPGGSAAGPGPPGAAGGATAAPGALVDINTGDLAALDTLPGVGPVLAQRILDWRAEHGRFSTVDELGEVSGIGEKMLAQLKPKVTV